MSSGRWGRERRWARGLLELYWNSLHPPSFKIFVYFRSDQIRSWWVVNETSEQRVTFKESFKTWKFLQNSLWTGQSSSGIWNLLGSSLPARTPTESKFSQSMARWKGESCLTSLVLLRDLQEHLTLLAAYTRFREFRSVRPRILSTMVALFF